MHDCKAIDLGVQINARRLFGNIDVKGSWRKTARANSAAGIEGRDQALLEGCGLIELQRLDACFDIDVEHGRNVISVRQAFVVLCRAADDDVARRKDCEAPSEQIVSMFRWKARDEGGSKRRRKPRSRIASKLTRATEGSHLHSKSKFNWKLIEAGKLCTGLTRW